MFKKLVESFTTNSKDKQDIGHVTAICILTADKGDKRMGHSDPQILLGFSQGAILIYRIRASVYSYKASRIRVPVDLSEFTEFPGCKYNIMGLHIPSNTINKHPHRSNYPAVLRTFLQ